MRYTNLVSLGAPASPLHYWQSNGKGGARQCINIHRSTFGCGEPPKIGKKLHFVIFAKLEDFSSSPSCHSETELHMPMNLARSAASMV